MTKSILDIPAKDRNIIRIGAFDKAEPTNVKNKNDKIIMMLAGGSVLLSPLVSMAIVGIGGAILASRNKKNVNFKYLKVPYEQAVNLLKWNNLALPEPDQFYIKHPHADKIYLSAKGFHEALFEEKFNEVIRILMNLQPKEITVEHVEGYSKKVNARAGAQKSGIGGKGSFNYQDGKDQRILFYAQFKKPSQSRSRVLPKDLLWYPFENRWSSIVNGVINHELETVKMEITYSDDFGIGSDLQASMAEIVGGGVGAKYTKFIKTKWNVKATFW